MLMKLPQVRDVRNTMLADFGIREEVIAHMALKPQFDTRDTERALAGTDVGVPRLHACAEGLWDYWERTLDPDLYKDRSFAKLINGRTVVILPRCVERHRPGDGAEGRGQQRHPAARRARDREARGAATGDRGVGGTAHIYSADPVGHGRDRRPRRAHARRPPRDRLPRQQRRGARSAARSSCPRTASTDFERTMQLNYFGAIKIIMALLPHRARAQLRPHRQHLSRWACRRTRRASAPTSHPRARSMRGRASCRRRSLATASRSPTIHMPLVRTPMIAPTKLYDHFPTISTPTRPPTSSARRCARARRRSTRASAPPARSCTRWRRRPYRPDPPHRLPRVPGLRRVEGREGPGVGREGKHGADRDGEHHEGRALVASRIGAGPRARQSSQ